MTEKRFDVLVAGELNVDLILDKLERFPVIGKEIIAGKSLLTLGSSAAIFASNLSTLGSSVSFCGRVGSDSFADKILHDLKAKNVYTDYISKSTTADTGITVAFNYNQDRAMVTYPGAMLELKASDITHDMLASAKHLHVSSIFLQPALKSGLTDLFKRAKQSGLTTSLDTQWDPAEEWEFDKENLLPYVDVFFPNMEELKNITQQSSVEEAVNSLKDHANIIVVKNGINGAFVFYKDERFHQPAFINHHFADAIGAGDSFNAGFIHFFLQKQSLKSCAEFGALTGAINTTASGGTTAFSNFDTIKKTAFEKFNYTIKCY